MSDKKEEYYQPWTRDGAENGQPTQGAPQQPGQRHDPLSDALPPMGLDLSGYADQEKGVRAPLIDAEKIKNGTAKALAALRRSSAGFAQWTINLGQKADIPTRIEKLEIPRRSKELARRSGVAAAEATRSAAEATRSAAEGTAKASKASAAKSKEIWEKMALADKVGKISTEAGRGLSDIADKTKTGLGQVAKAGKDSLSETAGKLRPVPQDETPPPAPPSGLEQLLAREEQEERNAADMKSASELPLFSDDQDKAAYVGGAAVLVDSATVPAPQPKISLAEPEPIEISQTPIVTAAAPVPSAAIAPTATAASELPVPPVKPDAEPVAALSVAAVAPQPTATPTPSPAASPTPPKTEHHISPNPAPKPQPRPVPDYEVINRAPAAAPLPPRAAAFSGFSVQTMALAGAALAAMLGTSYWLGTRFGGGMSKADVETIVADYITTNPQIIPAALEAQRDREIAKAIDAVRPALEKPYAGAWGGSADGDVTLVVFTDYACGFCKASVPDIDRLIQSDKRLKVVYRELPIISRESRSAAMMALAAARQGKYDAFHHAMFAQSSLSPSAIIAAADQAGVSLDGSGDATADEALFQRELESNLALGNQLQLNATPTWVIGDQLMQGQVGFEALRAAITRARTKQAG